MRAALAVVRVGGDPATNVAELARTIAEAAHRGADLVLFPEAVLTGLINNDDPAHDLPLGQPIPGEATAAVGAAAATHRVWICLGLLERAGERLYDAAVLIDDSGTIRLNYRRINPQWTGRSAPPLVYGQGTEVPVVRTPWGRMSVIICGDLFDDAVVEKVRQAAPDWLLFPFARCFEGGGIDQVRWDTEEMPAYVARICQTGVPTLMVNYLADDASLPDDESFGGAFAVLPDGRMMAQLPLGQAGLLMVDLA